MTGGCRMNDSNRNIAIVPISDILAGFYLTDIKALLDSLQVVLEPVSYQERFAIGGFDKIL